MVTDHQARRLTRLVQTGRTLAIAASKAGMGERPSSYSSGMHILRAHPEVGARLLDGSDLPVLQMARDIALSHHERCNGSGYPQGLSGPQVPESARLVAIADVYDALVSDRVYRPAFPEDVALAMMHEGRGRQFDPVVLDRFVELLPSVKVLREGMRNGHPSLPSLLVAAG